MERIGRLARSLSHLVEVIEPLEAKGAFFFRSLTDPIDTSSPQGKFTLQFLGAAAEFERALIRERTKAGLVSAKTKGRVGVESGPAICTRLEAMRERTPRGRTSWQPSLVKMLPERAEKLGLRE